MKFRNEYEAFDGDFILEESNDEELIIRRDNGKCYARLIANLKTKKFEIELG